MMFQWKSKKMQGGARCMIYVTQDTLHWRKHVNILITLSWNTNKMQFC